MTGFSNSPKLLKGGIVLIDAETARVKRIVSAQYNLESLSRMLHPQAFGEPRDRLQVLWVSGLPLKKVEFDEKLTAINQIDMERSTA